MSDTSLNKIIQYGTAAARAAFVPAPAAGSKVLYIWYDTDAAPNTYIWNGAAWVQINPSGGASTTSRFIVSTTEAGLPNSAVLTAGAGIVITGTTGTTTVRNSSTTANFIVTTTEATLPNSRVLTAGANVTFTTSTTQLIINSSGGGGGGGGWTFVTSTTPSGTGGVMSFTGLGGYNEVMILYRGVRGTPDFGFTSRVRVSTDNGATYLSASGDYVSLSSQGVETNETDMKMHATVSSGLKTGWRIISNFNTTKPKNSITPLDGGNYVITTTSTLSAIQIFTSTGLDWDTVGTMYIFGKA